MISVIITCHNLEKYIGEAIESALGQDYLGELEILVIDDRSTDSSASVVSGYPGVRCISTQSNLGVLEATILGIKETSGEHVFFLDGDDVWEKNKISSAMNAFDSDAQYNLVTHDLSYIDSDGNSLNQKSRPEIEFLNMGSELAGEKVRRGILEQADYVWLGSAYAVHRTKADLHGFCSFAETLPDTFNTYQDWPLAYWAAAQPGMRAAYVPEKLFRYRLHGANHSGDSTDKKKAKRNLCRALNTVEATYLIALKFGVGQSALHATRRNLRFCRYGYDLYAGHKLNSILGYVSNIRYFMLDSKTLIKESIRFLGINILGIDCFIDLANKYKRLRGHQ